jgi:hypothetical protein
MVKADNAEFARGTTTHSGSMLTEVTDTGTYFGSLPYTVSLFRVFQ